MAAAGQRVAQDVESGEKKGRTRDLEASKAASEQGFQIDLK
jgi:hypothetical protein